MSETQQTITWILGTTISVAAVLGLLVRYALLPYLRENLELAKETNKQVTVNGHSSDRPTVLDALSDIRAEMLAMRQENVDHISRLGDRLDDHLRWHLDRH